MLCNVKFECRVPYCVNLGSRFHALHVGFTSFASDANIQNVTLETLLFSHNIL